MSPGQSRLFLDQLPDKKSAKSAEKRRSYPAAFAKYRFYLDIRSARVKAALIEDILALGGVSSLNTGPVYLRNRQGFGIRKPIYNRPKLELWNRHGLVGTVP